jgi:hypothetical protein
MPVLRGAEIEVIAWCLQDGGGLAGVKQDANHHLDPLSGACS